LLLVQAMRPQQARKLSNGTWLVIAVLAFAAVVGIGRMVLLSGQDRSPATAPHR
jgi:hypothetical protein